MKCINQFNKRTFYFLMVIKSTMTLYIMQKN